MEQQVTIGAFLEAEHQRVEECFQQFQQHLSEGQVEAAPFEEAARILYRHIYLEEEVVFPEVEIRGMQGPPALMEEEHGEICRFLNDILELVRGDASPEQIQGSFNTLVHLLEGHNFKEEKMLYPEADRLLDRSEVVRQLEEYGLPDGWVCHALRSVD